jgi:FKBP-type peptidyl-prolyl cis-trans isomerase
MMKYVIGAVVIVALAIGGYFIYASMNTASTATGEAAQQNEQAAGDQVQAQEVTIGTGAQAVPGSEVSVLYVGQLTDGTVFDSSAAHGNEPLTFILGNEGMIPGFQIGVNGMREGGERLIAIPPSLAYGAQDVKDASGKIIIPANSTIIFNVRLVSVKAPATTTAQ